MFNELIIREGSVRNTVGADGAVEGFSFETHIAYYRGLGLSMVEAPDVVVDGEAVPVEDLRLRYKGVARTLAELADVADVRWELGTFAEILVRLPGGLAPGEHEITVNQRLRVSYMPVLTENRFTRKVEVGR